MKFIEADDDEARLDVPVLELTERNLWTLLDKLTDPNSRRTLLDPDNRIAVRAVPDAEHYKTRAPGETLTHGVRS